MSRVLKTGTNQITFTYADHVAKVQAKEGWAKGIDIVKKSSQCDYIVAHSAGKVIKVMTGQVKGKNDSEGMGYGNYVMILHDSNIVTVYAHLASVAVGVGQTVSKGTVLGYMGNTGKSYAAHLHFEIRKYRTTPEVSSLHKTFNYEWLDPTDYLDTDLPCTMLGTPKTYYRVQTGSFLIKAYAVRRAKELLAKGFDVCIKRSGLNYRVQVGAFEVKSNAEGTYNKLKNAGYACYITTESGTDVGF